MKTFPASWLLVACSVLAAPVCGQDAQKGRSEARMEMTRQIGAGGESFEVQATREALKRAHRKPLMTPMESTDAFLSLDRNGDVLLSYSEVPPGMPLLRSQFMRYDLNGDHRLSYSEFANYTDVVPSELARGP
jgi:hypothetical protein